MGKGACTGGFFASFHHSGNGRTKINCEQDRGSSRFRIVYEFQRGTLFKAVSAKALRTYVSESMKVPARVWKAASNEGLTVDYSKVLVNISVPT